MCEGEAVEKSVEIYDSMPKDLRESLRGVYLGATNMGHAKAEKEEHKLRGLEIFYKCKSRPSREEKPSFFLYNAPLLALLETNQFDKNAFACERDEKSGNGVRCDDVSESVRLMIPTMQYNKLLIRLDWNNALRLALELPERAPYWIFLKWMNIRAKNIIQDVPSYLMLPQNTYPPEAFYPKSQSTAR
ncbi:hypothetical protein PsorP6_017557 [Peronosclerospora sorghi]|uniref:Uncharacterized protein n=1 Tax=Peronosclerospora sorghi TaxID=230839 RepID=A0ACC0WP33_9STRA|nr:hypothetical protein PsorP6_017557 [Peronosclerospora sorghi]